MQFGSVQDACTGGCSTGIGVCCLAALELFYQVVYFFLSRSFELNKPIICAFVDIDRRDTLLLNGEERINVLMNLRVVSNNFLQIHLRNLNIDILWPIIIHKILQF